MSIVFTFVLSAQSDASRPEIMAAPDSKAHLEPPAPARDPRRERRTKTRSEMRPYVFAQQLPKKDKGQGNRHDNQPEEYVNRRRTKVANCSQSVGFINDSTRRGIGSHPIEQACYASVQAVRQIDEPNSGNCISHVGRYIRAAQPCRNNPLSVRHGESQFCLNPVRPHRFFRQYDQEEPGLLNLLN